MKKTEEAKKTAEEVKKEALDNMKSIAKEEANKATEEVKKTAEELSKSVEAVKNELSKEITNLSAELKKQRQIRKEESKKTVSIADAITSALTENQETLKSFKGTAGLAIKEVTDASWVDPALTHQTTEVRRTLYNSPYSPLYLRNIFPNVSTDSSSIVIPQVQSIAGNVDVWDRSEGIEKPEVTPSYEDINVPIQWIAGITHVNRELLLNVNYLRGSITNTLLYSRNGLFAAENKLIADYLTANAPAYTGTATIPVEKIIDAAFNQLLGNYMTPTHVLMNQADYLTHIKLNKATGSGEYDLPNDLLRGFTGSGLETTVQIVPVPTLAPGAAYVVSAPEFEFINRLAPELQVSEHHDKNFTFNKVTFRVEEMVGFVAKDLNAMVKVELATVTP